MKSFDRVERKIYRNERTEFVERWLIKEFSLIRVRIKSVDGDSLFSKNERIELEETKGIGSCLQGKLID